MATDKKKRRDAGEKKDHGGLAGTPGYMAPESCVPPYDFDARVDVPLHLRSLRVVAQQGVERRMFFLFPPSFFSFFISKVLIDAVQ